MRPSPTPSTFFAADQQWLFRVRSWDTPQTALENDTATEGLQLRVYEPAAGRPWSLYASNLTGQTGNPNTFFVDADPLVTDGRWPVIQAYWGGGTPNWWSGSVAGQVAVAFRGTLVSAARRAWLTNGSTFTFAAAGSGTLRIDVIEGATRTTLMPWTDLSEGRFLAEGFVFSSAKTLVEGAVLEVFYVQKGTEPWGGLVLKVLPTQNPTQALAADAPVVSGSLFAYGNPVQAVTLPFILEAQVAHETGGASRLDLQVPLVNADASDGHGWVYSRTSPTSDPGAAKIYDGGTLIHTLKRKRLIRLEVARNEAVPTWMPIFTGHVHDFEGTGEGRLSIQCLSFESRLVEQYEQAPDRISYMARGFRLLDPTNATASQLGEPVYNIPAFDRWPLAWAVEELGMRAGLDPSVYRKTLEAVKTDGTGVAVTLPWGTAKRFRAESLTGTRVKLPRAVHYGNAGLAFTETRPFDDAYLFKVEPTQDLWARVRALTEKMGYICRFDATGAAILYPANVPTFAHDFVTGNVTSGTMTAQVNADAYGASYLKSSTGAVTVQTTQSGSRFDLSLPRADDARAWTVTIARASAPATILRTVTIDPDNNGALELYFSANLTELGTNSTLVTLYSGDYDSYVITLTSASSASKFAYLDCLFVYPQDPDASLLPALSTSEAALTISARGQQDATRNKITIVGRRKAAVTDSEKFTEAQAPTEQEFVVANAVDVRSITDPTASNYVGYLKQSVIYDDTIADDGFARYLAAVFIYRHRNPQPGAGGTHTLLPMLEQGDPVFFAETKYDTVQATTRQYIRKITHHITLNRFETNVEAESFPDFPAYQPRTDINLADFAYKPVINLGVAYTSLAGYPVTNPTTALVKPVSTTPVLVKDVPVTQHSGGWHLPLTGQPWPPIPGTLQIRPSTTLEPGGTTYDTEVWYMPITSARPDVKIATIETQPSWYITKVEVWSPQGDSGWKIYTAALNGPRTDTVYYTITGNTLTVIRGTGQLSYYAGVYDVPRLRIKVFYKLFTGDTRRGWLANNPYARFVDLNYNNAATVRCHLAWKQDGYSGRNTNVTHYHVRYRALGSDPNTVPAGVTPTAEPYSPFYDPYTSELGQVVTISMDVLAEGNYRISIRSVYDDTIVAWLTNAAADPLQEEQHWEYFPIGSARTFAWDGVDQLGEWNAAQSELYSRLLAGSFEENRPLRVGRGYYAWNRELQGAGLGPLAYIWAKRDANGKPIIGHGTYAEWYVHVEAVAEALPTTSSTVTSGTTRILTHLPEPTKLELKVQDYVGTEPSGSWGAVTDWGSATVPAQTALGAYINNAKPVRLRFKVAPRPGVLWSGKESEVSVKLNREVHLRAMIGDQTVVFRGKEFPGTTVEDRAVYNRRLLNDEHTKQYQDSGYRKASTFRWDDGDTATTEWVFRPSDFKRDFELAGLEEPIEFGNYLQLEEVPGWTGSSEIAGSRARLQFALMSYLFYFSAYVTDRSGRSTWGLNRSFIDQSKITFQDAFVDWPDDPMYEQRRTVITRQWTNEPGWVSGQRTAFGAASGSLFEYLLQHWWWQHEVTATTIGTDMAPWLNFPLTRDHYSHAHGTLAVSSDYVLPPRYGTNYSGQLPSNRQLGAITGGSTQAPTVVTHLGTPANLTGGTWTWETGPTWIPSITRDLHPYFRLPPMMSPQKKDNSPAGVEVNQRLRNTYTSVGGPDVEVKLRDKTETKRGDVAAAETWTSGTWEMAEITTNLSAPPTSKIRFWPGYQMDNQGIDAFKGKVSATSINYVRQDETLHYEDFRGIYSRGPYPTANPVKVAAAAPYYLNQGRYYGVEVGPTLNVSPYPLFHVIEKDAQGLDEGLRLEWFRMTFRSEYVWESGSLFPTDLRGAQNLGAVSWWRTRYLDGAVTGAVYYDYGAWVGWKDDIPNAGLPGGPVIGGLRLTSGGLSSPFVTGHMPVGVGPVLPSTYELTAHLVLVPERRGDG